MKRSFSFFYNGEKITVAAERQGDTLTIQRDGASYILTLLPGDDGVPGPAPPGAPAVVPAAVPSAPAHNHEPPGVSPSPSAPAAGSGDIPAPMTGVIKEILVSLGDQVAEGELIMIMEAMKMDIEVTSHHTGSVEKIHVQPNDSVKEGQALVKIG